MPSTSVAEHNPDRDGSAASTNNAQRPARCNASTAAAANTDAPAPEDPANTGTNTPNGDQSAPTTCGDTGAAYEADTAEVVDGLALVIGLVAGLVVVMACLPLRC